jgi:hypothetical protein
MNEERAKIMRAGLIAILLAATAALPCMGQPQPQSHFALTAQQVARVLSDRGMPITGDHVSLLANVVATEPHPVLDILSVKPWGNGAGGPQAASRSLVKLACRSTDVCLPFYAVVTGPDVPAKAAPTKSVSYPVATGIGRSTFNSVMRAGTEAILILDDKRSHVQLRVISLQNGNAGDRIRVSTPDHKQFYVAEVVNAYLLKRSF